MNVILAARASLGALAAGLIAAPVLADDMAEGPGIVITAPSTVPFEEKPVLDKTGTDLFSIPRSIQIVPRELIDQQGGTQLRDTLRNVSGLVQGGQYAFGFYDRFIVRGLNVSFLNDGLPDTTSDLGGYVHSLTGVERVEVLKGPGSALFGSTEPGGTINIVHYRPQDEASASVSAQYGSFDTTTADISLNTPLGHSGLDARIDGRYQRGDGYRGQRNKTAELYGSLGFHPDNHDILARLEYHRIEMRPDSIGLPYPALPAGQTMVRPLAVDPANRYYTPFAFADQTISRAFLSDAWTLDDGLVLNLRTAYSNRKVDVARNAGGRITGAQLTGRQLRLQHDAVHDFVFQAEPTWKFNAGAMPVTLVGGAEYRRIDGTTRRSTADVPNIANINAPVAPETNLGSLTFQCNAAHSCNDAEVAGRFYSVYGIGQIDITPQLKLRISAREDFFRTLAEGRSIIPTNPGSEHPCTPPQAATCPFVPGQPVLHNDDRFEYDVGAVYQIADAIAFFGGYARNSYPIFNTEEPQSIGQVPEKGTQVEAGARFRQGSWLSLSSSLFRTTRRNVFTILNNASEVYSYRVRGWETDLNLRPVPQWNIIANYTLQDPRLIDYPQNAALVGNLVPSVPKRIGNVWTSYDFGLPEELGTLQIAGGVRYRSRFFGDAAQTRILPGATQFDLSAALIRGRWTIRGGVNNVTDKINYDYAAGVGGGAIPGRERTFFVSAGVRAF